LCVRRGICQYGLCGRRAGPDCARETNQEKRSQRQSDSESHGKLLHLISDRESLSTHEDSQSATQFLLFPKLFWNQANSSAVRNCRSRVASTGPVHFLLPAPQSSPRANGRKLARLPNSVITCNLIGTRLCRGRFARKRLRQKDFLQYSRALLKRSGTSSSRRA
jgi:hypothetical protein